MFGEIVLALWTCAGLAWWVIALRLVEAESRKYLTPRAGGPLPTLSIFKPLPKLGANGWANFSTGLESFVAQLEDGGELLLGVHEMDRVTVEPQVRAWRDKYPAARIEVAFRSTPDDVANPKIAWQKILARHATGELWLWSDADIIAPPGFLQSARAEIGQGELMMTYPYVVRQIRRTPTLLEALFVNADFYPGVLLLRRSGPVDFGLGAAMLFRRDAFLERVDWNEIGASLADDFLLGQKLGPVRVGDITLETVATSASWTQAIAHDIRWAKTIRWNRPLGAFSRILVMPVAGLAIAVALHPANFLGWIWLVGLIELEAGAAAHICRRVGCRQIPLFGLELWSLWRPVLWLASWLPMPIEWNGRAWRRPQMEINSNEEACVRTH